MPLNWIRKLEIVSSADSGLITLYDTTLRDGSQGEDVLFSVEDKLRIAKRLDELGIPFIEGGWPGANPKDSAFFKEARGLVLKNSRMVAFGSTRRSGVKVEEDRVLQGLLAAETGAITLFGKSWDLHVTQALNISLEENLELIYDSIRYLKSRVDTVFMMQNIFLMATEIIRNMPPKPWRRLVMGGRIP
jgi:2-isopropylmalate synthase